MRKHVPSSNRVSFKAANGKFVQSLFDHCETCKRPLSDQDFEKIASMPAHDRFDTIITPDCSRCVEAGLLKDDYQVDLSRFIDDILRDNGAHRN